MGARLIDMMILWILSAILMISVLVPVFASLSLKETGQTDEYGNAVKTVEGFSPWILFILLGLTGVLIVAPFLYEYLMTKRYAATLGKRVMGIVVVDAVTGTEVVDDSKIAFKRSLGVLIESLGGIIAYIVNLVMVSGDQRKSIQDHLAGTLVVKKR